MHGKIEYWKELLDNDTYSSYWQAATSPAHEEQSAGG